MNRIKINIKAQEQVGAVQFYQVPSSNALEKLQLSFADEYEQRSYVLDAEDAGELLNQFTTISNNNSPTHCTQITFTTMEGGLMRADIKQTRLYSTATAETPEARDPYLDADGAGGDGDYNRERAKSLTHSFTLKSVNIATHPEIQALATTDDLKTAIGIICNGGSEFEEFRSSLSAGSYVSILTPNSVLSGLEVEGKELLTVLKEHAEYQVKVINVSFTFSSSTAPKNGGNIGKEVPMTSIPKNANGSLFGKQGKAFLVDILCDWKGLHFAEITEKYQVEIIPTLKELLS